MIKHLTIRDFQSIEKLDIECGPITVIHGESDTGKSAVVRALYALAFNDYPKGHVRDGASVSQVVVGLDDGTEIGAVKGATENSYRMHATDIEPGAASWDKVGKDVPAEVASALGWRILELDDGSKFTPSFGLQFDPPFLLTDSPSRRAKVLGSLTNVATLYAAIKEANTWERRAKTRADTHQATVDEVTPEIDSKAAVVEANRLHLEALHEIIAQARHHKVKKDLLVDKMAGIAYATDTVDVAKAAIAMLDASTPTEEMANVGSLLPKLQGLTALNHNLMVASGEVDEMKVDVGALDRELSDMSHRLQVFRDENPFCPMCGSDERWREGGHDHG